MPGPAARWGMETASPPRLVLHATASVCPVTGAAGWAAVVLADGVGTRRAGSFRGPVRDPAAAEMAAMANGLAAALSAGAIAPGAEVELRSGCAEVRQRLLDDPGAASDPRVGRAVGWIREAARANGLALSVEVPGRLPEGLDAEARRRMSSAPPARAGGRTEPVPRDAGALGEVMAAWAEGACNARRLKAAVADVADRQRRDPAAWARTCERIGLSFSGLWAREPARAEREASGISGEDVASYLMGRRDPRAVLSGWIGRGDFPEDAGCLRAAERHAAGITPAAAPGPSR